jgi:nitrate/nitrite transport system substrate-binding protein
MTKPAHASARRGFRRRQILKATAGAAALFAAIKLNLPAGAFAQGAGPEVQKARLGFVAMTDAVPLFAAREKGLFAKHGMPGVEVEKQASWGTTRDNLVLGSDGNGIDGAHIPTPMPYLIATGLVTQNNTPTPMHILARLDLNGQAILVGNDYADLKVGLDAAPFKAALQKKKEQGRSVRAAMTFSGGSHDLWIRYWLAAGGIDPDKDIETIVVPPPQMAASMKAGIMDCLCVGGPWNGQLIDQKAGYAAVTTGEIWKDHPENVLAMRAAWVERNPRAAKALLMAVMEAQQWCDSDANKDEIAAIGSKRPWMNLPLADSDRRIKGDSDDGSGRAEKGSPPLMKLWRDHASYPFRSHDAWFITENIRWGKIPADTDIHALVAKVNREDLWKEAAKDLGVAAADIPTATSRGQESFFDGKVFDPENPQAYLKSLTIKRVES